MIFSWEAAFTEGGFSAGKEGGMQIQNKKIDELKPYARNPRKNDGAVDSVAKSIQEFGFKVPIIIDANGEIIAGHTRLKAAKKLGLQEVPCIVADDLTPEQIKAFRLVDNKTAELAEWDFDALSLELEELDLSGFDLDWGLPENAGDRVVEDDPPEVDEHEQLCKPGDIWLLGEHRLICGDSTDREVIEKLFGGEEADLCVTDPPYNVDLGNGGSQDEARKRHRRVDGKIIMNDNMGDAEFLDFLTRAFSILNDHLKSGCSFYVFHADNEGLNFRLALKRAGLQLRQTLIWKKSAFTLGRQDYQWIHEPILYGWKDGSAHRWYSNRAQATVLEFDRPSKSREHPTMKPIALIAYIVGNSSERGDIVFDGFGGSGSTLIACEQLGRKCYTVELDPRYADVIIKRWEQFTGRAAVKEAEAADER